MNIYEKGKVSGNIPFPHAILSVNDTTFSQNVAVERTGNSPRFNMLFPIKVKEGITDILEQYYPGEATNFALMHGNPSYITQGESGIACELIHQILAAPSSNIGIYTINLSDENARAANVVLMAKMKVEADVPKLDADGNPLYLTPDGVETTIPDGNTPIVRDVLRTKYYTESIPDISTKIDLDEQMRTLYTGIPDIDGFTAYPVFGFMYNGRTAFGNTCYFRLSRVVLQYSDVVYYNIEVFDGRVFTSYTPEVSLARDSGSMFLPNVINYSNTITSFKCVNSYYLDDYLDIVESYINKTAGKTMTNTDIFTVDLYDITVESDSMTVNEPRAFQFATGVDTVESFDALAQKFFRGEIINDITDILRYRINYVVDLDYSDELKSAITEFCDERIVTTRATLMRGSSTFESAVNEWEANFKEGDDNIRQLAKCQHGYTTSVYTNRSHRYPATYFDTIAYVNHVIRTGSFYEPFAGADARWTGFEENTIITPSNDFALNTQLALAKINMVRADNRTGLYLVEQYMNTGSNTGDTTEFSNQLIVSNIVYDIMDLIHRNNMKFNEASDIASLRENVDANITPLYTTYVSAINIDVYRKGTTGEAAKTNIVDITIDFKDIRKNAEVNIMIQDQ